MSQNNAVIFGNFVEPDQGDVVGRMALKFQSATLNLDDLWESSSLSAGFLSTFWGKFFPARDTVHTREQVKDEVRYISGELLGNAVKFSFRPEYQIEICLYMHEKELRFYITNSLNPDEIGKFQSVIRRILTEDTMELFLEQMEKNAAEESEESGVGFLTLLNDYGVDLAWKFEDRESEIKTVTVFARLPIIRNKK